MNSIAKRFGGWCLLAALLLSRAVSADTAHVAEDAHIDLGQPGESNGTVPNLVVSNIVDRKSGERLTFVSYDLPGLPDGANLEQAWLRLFVSKVGAPGDIDLYLVTEPWDEHGISGATAPGFEALPFTTFTVAGGDAGHFIAVDVTPEVQAWLEGAEPNHGFVLVGNPGTDVDVSIDSKENSQTSHQSELELVLGTAVGGVDSDDIADGSITSDDIADDSITSDDIEDGAIGSDDIADNSVTGSDILDGTVGGADVDKDQVQLRVNGTCAAGSSIREIDNMGGVVCEPDDDSGGDITSVFPAAGGGLEGGAASGDAELGIAPNGVNSAMVADGAIGAADVNEFEVQRRVWEGCNPDEAIRYIAADGEVICVEITDTTLDPDLFWKVGGNSGTLPIPGGPHFVGTTDNRELVLGVNDTQALRLAYYADEFVEAVNTVGGHPANQVVNSRGATIGGGGYLHLSTGNLNGHRIENAQFGTIGGGSSNEVFDSHGFIGGGAGNSIGAGGGGYSVIAGGLVNTIEGSSLRSSIIGGERNRVVESWFATIGGGTDNKIYDSSRAFIGGGEDNVVCDPDLFPDAAEEPFVGSRAVIAGGLGNNNCTFAGFIGGGSSNTASGDYAMVIGGYLNQAVSDYSLAAGRRAVAQHEAALVWADSSDNTDFSSMRDHQARFRATGGARFDVGDDAGTASGGDQWVDIRTQALNTLGNNPALFRLIDTSTGAYLSLGGGWVNASDRERKTDIRDVDANWILEQVAAMPIQTWRYKVEGGEIRHIGPMAQDFQAAFGFGGDPRGIMSVDADGVALAAIQALYRMTAELERRTQQLEAQQQRLDALEASLQALEARLDPFDDQRLARAEVNLASE